MTEIADLVFVNAKVTTMDPGNAQASAVAIKGERFLAVGSEADVMRHVGSATRRVDLQGKRVIPRLFDSHAHTIRGGLNYAMELRWDGVPTLE